MSMEEVSELVASMAEMFPQTPIAYLEEQCEDIVGKPAAIERFIDQLSRSDSQPPVDWVPGARGIPVSEEEQMDQMAIQQILEQTIIISDDDEDGQAVTDEAAPPPLPAKKKTHEEDLANKRLATLVTLFPSVDPEFLHRKGVEFGFDAGSEETLNLWIDANVDQGFKEFPTRAEYEKRVREAEIIKKYQSATTLKEILAMKDDPEANFTEETQKVHEIMCSKRKEEVQLYNQKVKKRRQEWVAVAEKVGALMVCQCCYADDCLEEEMLPCQGGHMYCLECIQRGSEVAIGEGKTQLRCLGQCGQDFALSTLQLALKPHIFAKWTKKIQVDELEKAGIDGLEQCPFCPFATIMESTPEENKIFSCQNPDCGKESCRLCQEVSHIPKRCGEENDAEVQKRTYIENRMSEALMRKCWKCKKPFVKIDGCNRMTCNCRATMCYLCRQPNVEYAHFYGSGGVPTAQARCALWSNNNEIHEREVNQTALEAKRKMEVENPQVQLKYDPTAGIKTQ